MSVRSSLLAILDQGPCYGYQLRAEFHRRTGASTPLNVGQIYNTLDRLERDGLVSRGDTDAQGHVYYMITDAGSAQVRDWLGATVARPTGTRDELPLKLALAATLPGVDVTSIVARQRAASCAELEALREAAAPTPGAAADGRGEASPNGETLARQLVADARVFQAEAELRWLDHVAARLAEHPARTLELGLGTERPRRGRPPHRAAPIN
ncbi:MAG: PadR family transcriptional regulator [Microthrixaceae bacterium]|nr:PadR family transcriptional regulator [Microthrixaceae bacterium]